EQFVISSQCGQIVPPGIAVSLRIEDFCIFSVDDTVGVDIGNVIGADISHLAIAAGEIPKQPIIDRRSANTGSRIIPTAQQREILVQERIQLILEGKNGSGKSSKFRTIGGKPYCWVGGIGKGFVAEQHIQVRDAAGGQQQSIVEWVGVD